MDAVKPLPIADIAERKVMSFLPVLDKLMQEAEKYARENRPWTDRTGQARKLIKGIVLDGSEKSYDVYKVKPETVKDKDGKTLYKGKLEKAGTATIKDSEGKIGIALVHRVDYGKALEEANSGKYAILTPALEHLKPRFMELAREYFGGKG